MQNSCKGDEPCQWNTRYLGYRGSKTPEPIDIKFGRGDFVGDITPHANFGISIPGGAVVHHPCLFFTPRYFFISCAPVEIAPFDRFSCFMTQKTCFGDSYVIFGMRTKNFNNFHYFSQTRNSLFPPCKTSIGNNSGSIKDRLVKFAYSRGLSAISDRMV